jgi:hypothetical protein
MFPSSSNLVSLVLNTSYKPKPTWKLIILILTGAEDIEAIKSVADKVKPLVPVVVDAVYAKLFTYNITKKHFLTKNDGFTGPVVGNNEVAASLEELTLDNAQIKVNNILGYKGPQPQLADYHFLIVV